MQWHHPEAGPTRSTWKGADRCPTESGSTLGSKSEAVRRRVLVVDDNADAADLLAQALRLMGHVVEVAHDGQAALAAAQAFRPDTVLLDIGLPVMDGYEVARRLRAGAPHLLLVAITGYGQSSDVERAHEAGFDHHLVKPVPLGAVRSLLEQD